MVENKKTCLISGATGSGKTTVFKALLGKLPIDERVITFEDTPELVVPSPNYVSLRSNALQGVTPQVLVKLAMRMRPDRIFAGELRDGTALDWLDACNTGHPGSIATLHANDAINALLRLESLALMANGAPPLASVRQRILSTIDFVVHIGKDGQPGMVEEVVEVLKQDDHVGLGYHTNTRALYQRFLVH
jgi:pilus assembly protein CpaF